MNWKNVLWGIIGLISGLYVLWALGGYTNVLFSFVHPIIFLITSVLAIMLFCASIVVLYSTMLAKKQEVKS